MSITERMENDGMSFEDARMKESLLAGGNMNNMTATEVLLAERGKTHGDFRDHADTTQQLKRSFYLHCDAQKLSAVQREAAEMILHKLGRIAAGDPNFQDHWDDIAGYAKLVSQDLQRK